MTHRRAAGFLSLLFSLSLFPPNSYSAPLKPSDDAASLASESPSPTLEEVLVTARRSGQKVPLSEFPANATVITAEKIAKSGAASLPELLRKFDGITMMDFSGFGLGADATVNLRGVVNSSRNGALVLVNGVRQNGLTSDEIHWQSIPIDQVERVEIIRGGGAITYGEGALSGVVNVVLKQGAERPLEFEQTVLLGTYGRKGTTVSARGSTRPWRYGTSFRRMDVSGYRESTGSRATTVTTHFGVDITPNIAINTDVLHSEDTTYFSGGITPEQSQQRRRQAGALPGFNDNRMTQVSMSADAQGPYGLSLLTRAHWRWRTSDIFTRFGDFATLEPSRGLTVSAGHESEADWLKHTFVGGIDLVDEKASTGTRGDAFSESNKEGYGLFAEEALRFADRVSVVGGVRFDHLRFQEDITFPAFVGTLGFEGWSPSFGVTADLVEGLTAYAHVARPFKAPNVFDFAVAIPFEFTGNTNLQAQQGIEYEMGLRAEIEKLARANVAWFLSRVNDEILFNSLMFQNDNFDTSRMGVEFTLEPTLPISQLQSSLTYTFLEAEFRKGAFKENSVPGVPEHQLGAHVAFELLPELFLIADWILVQDFFRINDFNNALPGDNYGLLNLGVRYTHRNATLHFIIENATNEEYTSFQSSTGLIVSTGENPAPPISFRCEVTIRF